MKQPTPRPGVYELYWQFAAKRQEAFYRRLNGEVGPWSHDPILQEYKFCNVFRAADRVSQYMIREVCYDDQPRSAADAMFQIVAFRTFSRPETWEGLRRILGRSPLLDDLASGSFEHALCALRATGIPLYTGAFILCANDAYGRHLKHLNHVDLFSHMFLVEDIASELLAADSLEMVYKILHRFPLYGNFMAYQTAIDLNYSEFVNFSENSFTVPGPGALRGMRKMFIDLGERTPAEVVMWMVEHQDREFAKLGLGFDGLFGRKLHAIDAQGLFCETDKYCRVKLPALKVQRSRIKARFNPNPEPIELFLPPKWNLV